MTSNTLTEARLAVREAARMQGVRTYEVIQAVKLALTFGTSDEAIALLKNDYLVGYVAGRCAISEADASKFIDGKKADRPDDVQRAYQTASVYWTRIRDDAGAPKTNAAGQGRKANAAPDAAPAPKAEPSSPFSVPTFTSVDDAVAYIKTMASHMTACEKHNEATAKASMQFGDACEALRRIAAGDHVFVVTAEENTKAREAQRAAIKAEARAEIEAEIRAVDKAKREARKATKLAVAA